MIIFCKTATENNWETASIDVPALNSFWVYAFRGGTTVDEVEGDIALDNFRYNLLRCSKYHTRYFTSISPMLYDSPDCIFNYQKIRLQRLLIKLRERCELSRSTTITMTVVWRTW